jgi:uncharacterized protein YcaQ
LEAEFGRERVVNAWGGFSQATKKALEHLHYCGFVRVTRREKGIRVYGAASAPPSPPVPVSERLKKLIMVTANIFAPVTDRCLQEALSYLRRTLHEPPHTKTVISDLIKSGELQKESVDGIDYLYPSLVNLSRDEVPSRVQFLAPFDPLVWDRRRFEHFWGWAYRFEAYTPPQKRLRGYYAMPMLWGDQMVGWANVTTKNGVLDVEVGFAEKKQTGSDFRADLEKEIGRMETFLKPKE